MAASDKKYIVRTKKDGLNLREKPTKESRILRLIPNGDTVAVDPSADTPFGWYAVKGGGYVMAEFLNAMEEPANPETDGLWSETETANETPRRGRRRKSEDN